MSGTLSDTSEEDDNGETKQSDELEMPEDLAEFVPSPKKRDVSNFTEEFSFVVLPHLGLVVVYITEVATGLSGFCNHLRQAIRLKNSDQEPCPYITHTAAEKQDPIRNVLPGVWGPYSRVNDREEVIQEQAQPNRKSYPATVFLLIPKLSSPPRRISITAVEEQVQMMATFCNDVYVKYQRAFSSYNHHPVRDPQKRSFGLARQPNRTNSSVHSDLPLNKFIARRHAVDFLVNAYNCDRDFYQNKPAIAKRLLHPPHSMDEKRLGYPFEGF